jgi:hypothetical protein
LIVRLREGHKLSVSRPPLQLMPTTPNRISGVSRVSHISHVSRIRTLAVAFAFGINACLLSTQALGQSTPRSYAVISEIARDVQAVIFVEQATGTRLQRYQRESLGVPAGTMDKMALLAVQSNLKTAAPNAKVWLLAPADTDFFEGGLETLAGRTVKLPSDLAAAFQENKTTHLLLLTRHKAAAAFQFENAIEGDTNLEGIGFFVERATRVINKETSTSGIGFLAPFVYFRASLIEVATGKVLKTETARASRIYGAGDAKGDLAVPWKALTPEEKMTTLRVMLEGEVKRVVPLLVAGP